MAQSPRIIRPQGAPGYVLDWRGQPVPVSAFAPGPRPFPMTAGTPPPNPWAAQTPVPGWASSGGRMLQARPQQQQPQRGRPAPQRPQGPVSAPQGGINWGAVFGQMGQGLAAPFRADQAAERFIRNEISRPQRPDEPDINYHLGKGWVAPFALADQGVEGIRRGITPAVNAVAGLFSTPNDRAAQVFQAMIKQESGGRQFDKNGRPLTSSAGAIGIAQVMPGTAPEAAKLAGLPWDPARYRNDPQYNAALGAAYFQQKLKENKGDYQKAVAAYNAGQGRVQSAVRRAGPGGDWTAFMPNETQDYLQKVQRNMGVAAQSFGAPAPGFNAAPYQNAMAAQDQAAALLQQPISATFSEAPLPNRPAPTEFAAPDFTAGNAAFAAAAPKNPFDDPKERRKVQWSGYMKGVGQALASLSGGEGIGTMLMKMGAGALMGRASGDERIEKQEEEFERNMQQYNLALASRNDQQAGAAANVLNQNIQLRNQYADQIWADNVQKIQKDNPQIVGDRLITRSRDPNDPNKVTMTSVPISNTIAAEALLNKANIGLQMGQAQAANDRYAFDHQQTVARTGLAMTVQAAQAEGNGQAATEGYGIEAASRLRATIRNGTWGNLFPSMGPELEQVARTRAYQQMGVTMRPDGSQPVMPLSGAEAKAFQEIYEDTLTGVLYESASKLGTVEKLFTSPTATRALVQQRSETMRRSQRTNAKGQTSTSMSWEE